MTNPANLAEPLVSIVLATNRDSPFLEATLKSVSDQTWQRWELIIVDDGGPDPSVLDELARPVPNCTVIHRPPGGVSMARNTGAAASQGEFLVFLDDDDIWHPDRLRRQVAEFRRDPGAVACYSSGWHIDEFGAEVPVGWEAAGATREQLLSGATNIPRIVTLMVRREPFITAGCFNTAFRLSEDNELVLRLLRHGRFTCSPDALVGYRRHGSNVSSSPLAEHAVSGRRAILLQIWAAEAHANHDDLRLMRQNLRVFRRRTAESWVASAVASVRSGHAFRASGELARAFGWSAPRTVAATATRLGRLARKPRLARRQGRKPVWRAGA